MKPDLVKPIAHQDKAAAACVIKQTNEQNPSPSVPN